MRKGGRGGGSKEKKWVDERRKEGRKKKGVEGEKNEERGKKSQVWDLNQGFLPKKTSALIIWP